MNVEMLEDLLALEALGGFARAAESRGVTQPTLSRRIIGLEEWAQAVLVDRSSHRTRLTEAGRLLARRAEEALRLLALGLHEARDAEQEARNIVRIACTHMLASTFFPGWLANFEESLEPVPAIQLIVADMVSCERQLRRGEVQLLLCHHADGAPTGLPERSFRRATLDRDWLVPVVKARDGAVGPVLEQPTERPVEMLCYRPESGLGRLLEASGRLARLAVAVRPVFHSHAALTLAHLARAGRGVAWLPMSLVEPDLASAVLVRAAGEVLEVPIEICLVRPAGRQSAAVEAVWRAATMAGEPGDPEGHARSA